jgi:arylsulfatase A-like enzyme
MKLRLFGLRDQFDHVDESTTCMKGDCAARINARALAWLSEQREGPWLCYIHYMDVHLPYKAPASFAGRFSEGYGVLPNLVYVDRKWRWVSGDPGPDDLAHVAGMYDAEVAYVDAQIRGLLRKLDVMGEAENLLIMVASDHGEELFERGAFGHGQTLYQEQIACPLIFTWPRRVPRGVTIDCPVQNIDIVPTIINLLNIEMPRGMQGSSLVSYFEGDCPRRPIFSENRGYSVRVGDWKVWREKPGLLRLHDLRADPAETVDLAHVEPDTLRSLRARLLAWRDSLTPPGVPREPEPVPSPDSAAVDMLRALGYVK